MEHLPPWLRNLPLPARPRGRAEPPSAAPRAADEVPSWLRELQSEVATDAAPPDADAAPDWLADLAAPAAKQPAPPAAADAPDWLADLAAPAAKQPAPPAAADAPDWLADLAAPADEQPPPDAQAEPPTTTSRIRMPVGATDWLRSIGQDSEPLSEPLAEPSPPADDQSGVPDWLRDLTADEVARAVEAEQPAEQMPLEAPTLDWLTNDLVTPDASTVSANWSAHLPDNGPTAPNDIPDWLRDEVGPPPPERSRPSAAQGLAGAAEVPAWLRDLADDEPATADSAADDEPTWLREAANRPPTDRLASAADEIDVPAWLRGPEAAPEVPAPEAPAETADEVPEWLSEVSVPSAPPMAADEVPDWLREPAALPSDAVPDWLQEPAAPARDDAPAWLRESAAPARDDAPAWLQEPAAPPSDDAPAWLRESAAPPSNDAPAWLQEPTAPPSNDAPAGPNDIPSWMVELQAGAESVTPPPPTDVPAPPADISWLTDDRPAPTAEPDMPTHPGELPPWLVGDDVGATPASPSAADPGLPSWLRGVAAEPPAAQPPARTPPPAPPLGLRPVAEEGDSNAFLSGTELPSWLRTPEPERPKEPDEGQTLDWLRRLGDADQEDEPAVGMAAAVTIPQRQSYQPSAEQIAAVGLLRQIAQAPYPTPIAPAEPAPLGRWQRIGLDRVLYGLLLLALLLALLAPVLTTPFQTTTPTAPGAAELSVLLDGLDDDDVVLVAYEWAAQRSSELRPLEQAVTSRLIANRTKLILVSTDMQGTLLSFDLIGPLRAAGYNNENGVPLGGRDYVLLGYRPGGELALRRLAQDLRGELRSDFDGQDATQSLVANFPDGAPRFSGIADLSMILVLADTPQDVQAWMEQVHRVAPNVPIAFVLPQQAQPVAQPYLRQPGVYAVAGQRGALALIADDPAGDPTALARSTGQLSFAVAIFLLLLLGGAVGAAVTQARAAREVSREP